MTHAMVITERSKTGVVFVCVSGCSRRVVVDRVTGMTVIDRGDFSALHAGGDVGLRVTS